MNSFGFIKLFVGVYNYNTIENVIVHPLPEVIIDQFSIQVHH